MVLRTAFLALILTGPQAVANDISPWFGSEASPATQVSLSSSGEPNQPPDDNISVKAEVDCPIEGCPKAAKPVN
jgi:hypothetical protein